MRAFLQIDPDKKVIDTGAMPLPKELVTTAGSTGGVYEQGGPGSLEDSTSNVDHLVPFVVRGRTLSPASLGTVVNLNSTNYGDPVALDFRGENEGTNPRTNNFVSDWPNSMPSSDRNVDVRMGVQVKNWQRCGGGAPDTSESAYFPSGFQSFLNFDVAFWSVKAQHLLDSRLKKANGGRLNG
jgi:hypothetical protein